MTDNKNLTAAEPDHEVSSRSVLRATAWLAFAKLASYGLGFIGTIALARILVPEDFGVIALSMAIIGIMSGLLDLPVTTALIALSSPTDDEFNTAWTISIIRSILISLLLLVIAQPMALLFDMPEVSAVIMVLTLQAMIFGLRNPYFENFARQMNFSWDVFSEIISKVVQVLVSVVVALIWKSYWAFVIGLLAGTLASMIITYVSVRQLPSLSLRSPRRLFDYSIWLGLSMIVSRLTAESVNLIAGRRFGQATLGQVHIGNKLSSDISYLMLIPIMRSLFSAFSRLTDDIYRFRHAYLKAQAATFALAMPVGFGLALIADPFIPLLLGPGWEEAVTIVQFYAPCAGLLLATGPIRSVAMALSRTSLMLRRDVVVLIVQVSCLLLGTWLYGFTGFLASYAISTVIATVINLFFLKGLIQISILDQVRNFIRSMLSTLVMIGAVLAVRQVITFPDTGLWNLLTVALLCLAGAVAYAGAHIAFWIVSGRPEGVEQTVFNVAQKLKPKLARFGIR
ncbi:MAG: oligosaccharide flippase family protein [Hyphomonas sp.]